MDKCWIILDLTHPDFESLHYMIFKEERFTVHYDKEWAENKLLELKKKRPDHDYVLFQADQFAMAMPGDTDVYCLRECK